jgi:hypothetical protein
VARSNKTQIDALSIQERDMLSILGERSLRPSALVSEFERAHPNEGPDVSRQTYWQLTSSELINCAEDGLVHATRQS